MGEFSPQELANTAWACAKIGQEDASLFWALAGVAEQHMGAFSP